MTDWPKFLAAVCAEPDDDLPRLLAADWLDGQGEPERAEFIRVQCELAKGHDGTCTGPGADFCWTCERLAALRKRERELLVAQCGWFPDCMEGFVCDNLSLMSREGMPTFLVVRGFPSRLTLSWQDWQTHADKLLASCPIRRVNRPKECPACHGRPIVPGIYAGGEWCHSCHGTGKVDDWRGEGKIVLTTWPEWHTGDLNSDLMRLTGCERWHRIPSRPRTPGATRAEIMTDLLAAEWPGVRFDLPQPCSLVTPNMATSIPFVVTIDGPCPAD